VDGIIFGGGIGENSPYIRNQILHDMKWCGIVLDPTTNAKAIGKEGCISSQDSTITVWVVPVDESIILAQEAITVTKNNLRKSFGGSQHEQ
jgi:acetate kinase